MLEELEDAIREAESDAKESHKAAMNSYGAGWDAGFCAGLRRAKEIMTGQLEPTDVQ